jgi:hypothetical protein
MHPELFGGLRRRLSIFRSRFGVVSLEEHEMLSRQLVELLDQFNAVGRNFS